MTDLENIIRKFKISGDFIDGEPYGSGHINDTYVITCRQEDKHIRYILQRINDHVFKNPKKVMENILRVTLHQHKKHLKEVRVAPSRTLLQLISSRNNKPYYLDDHGKYWRTYFLIENTYVLDKAETPKQAFEAAKAFGQFQKNLMDLPGERLHETISGFHDTENHFKNLEKALQEDLYKRKGSCEEEILFARKRKPITPVLVNLMKQGILPEHITHNDTKLNNVLFDDRTHKAICIIDLDTVMPGSLLYDFGDLVRSIGNSAVEDEMDLSIVNFQLDMFHALARGYVSALGEDLNKIELDHLVFSAIVITFECGMRFLADFMNGDQYFKTNRPKQNLDRCRNHFKLVGLMEKNREKMNHIIQNLR